jgi:hypothetical protein
MIGLLEMYSMSWLLTNGDLNKRDHYYENMAEQNKSPSAIS